MFKPNGSRSLAPESQHFHNVARGAQRGQLVPRLLVAPLIIGLIILVVYPTIYLLAISLSQSSLGQPFTAWVGLSNYIQALRDAVFTRALVRSTLLAVSVSLAQLALGVAIALLLHTDMRNGNIVRTLILLPLMTPPVMVAVVWRLLLAPVGGLVNGTLINLGFIAQPISFLGTSPLALLSIAITDIWQWTPFVVLLVYAALLGQPHEVHEAALVDGAVGWQIIWFITLPLIWPALLAVLLIRLIMAFKIFDLIYMLTFGGPGFDTTTGTFLIYRLAFQQFNIGYAAAQTLIFGLLVGLVTLPFVLLRNRSIRTTI